MPTEIGGQPMAFEPASDSAGSFMILWYDRVIGADGEALLQGMVDNHVAALPSYEATPTTVAGKEAVVLTLPDRPQEEWQYLYQRRGRRVRRPGQPTRVGRGSVHQAALDRSVKVKLEARLYSRYENGDLRAR